MRLEGRAHVAFCQMRVAAGNLGRIAEDEVEAIGAHRVIPGRCDERHVANFKSQCIGPRNIQRRSRNIRRDKACVGTFVRQCQCQYQCKCQRNHLPPMSEEMPLEQAPRISL